MAGTPLLKCTIYPPYSMLLMFRSLPAGSTMYPIVRNMLIQCHNSLFVFIFHKIRPSTARFNRFLQMAAALFTNSGSLDCLSAVLLPSKQPSLADAWVIETSSMDQPRATLFTKIFFNISRLRKNYCTLDQISKIIYIMINQWKSNILF